MKEKPSVVMGQLSLNDKSSYESMVKALDQQISMHQVPKATKATLCIVHTITVEQLRVLKICFEKPSEIMFQSCRGRILLASASVLTWLFWFTQCCFNSFTLHHLQVLQSSGVQIPIRPECFFLALILQLLKLCMSSYLSPQFNSYIHIFICILHHLRVY